MDLKLFIILTFSFFLKKKQNKMKKDIFSSGFFSLTKILNLIDTCAYILFYYVWLLNELRI